MEKKDFRFKYRELLLPGPLLKVAHHAPHAEEHQVEPDGAAAFHHAAPAVLPFAAPYPLREHHGQEIGDAVEQEGIVAPRLVPVSVEHGVGGALEAATWTVPPREEFEGAARKEAELRGVEKKKGRGHQGGHGYH